MGMFDFPQVIAPGDGMRSMAMIGEWMFGYPVADSLDDPVWIGAVDAEAYWPPMDKENNNDNDYVPPDEAS